MYLLHVDDDFRRNTREERREGEKDEPSLCLTLAWKLRAQWEEISFGHIFGHLICFFFTRPGSFSFFFLSLHRKSLLRVPHRGRE